MNVRCFPDFRFTFQMIVHSFLITPEPGGTFIVGDHPLVLKGCLFLRVAAGRPSRAQARKHTCGARAHTRSQLAHARTHARTRALTHAAWASCRAKRVKTRRLCWFFALTTPSIARITSVTRITGASPQNHKPKAGRRPRTKPKQAQRRACQKKIMQVMLIIFLLADPPAASSALPGRGHGGHTVVRPASQAVLAAIFFCFGAWGGLTHH